MSLDRATASPSDALVVRRPPPALPARPPAPLQPELPSSPARPPRPWTPDEEETARRFAEDGLSAREIGLRVGRTRPAVKQKLRELGVQRDLPEDWRPSEEAALRAGVAAGRRLRDLALEIGRSFSAVRWKSRALGLVHPAAFVPWSPLERQRLRALYAAGAAPEAIARELDRPLRGVYSEASRIGATGRLRRRWTEEEDDALRLAAKEGRPLEEAADVLGRPASAAARRVRKLRLVFRRREGPLRLLPSSAAPPRGRQLPPPVVLSAPPPAAPTPSPSPKGAPRPQRRPTAPSVRRRRPAKRALPRVRPEEDAAIEAFLARRRAEGPAAQDGGADAACQWLRSRGYEVVRGTPGWRVDRERLPDDAALVRYANVRRRRMDLPEWPL